jgi:hypothetical protein
MRTLIKSLFILLLFTSFSFSQSTCSKYYPFKEGTTLQYTNYDKKGKESGELNYKVNNYRKSDGKEWITMTMSTSDKKGNGIGDISYDISCDGSGISIDFKSLGNMAMLKQFESMETKVTGTNTTLPNSLSVGQELPDSNMNMEISMSGISMKVNTLIKDRKVTGKEKVTTPAGTYNCLILEQTTIADVMGKKISTTSKSWFAEGVGMVKQESHSKGKLQSKSTLTKFSN